jgi:hypothetical protein
MLNSASLACRPDTSRPSPVFKGLAAALESEARKGSVPTEVRSEGIGPTPSFTMPMMRRGGSQAERAKSWSDP